MDKKKVEELIGKAKEYILAYQKNNKNSDLAMAFLNLQNAERELSKSDWVSVEDELPEYNEDVEVCNKTYPARILVTTRCKDVFYDNHNFIIQNMHVTHWKPIEKLDKIK